MGRFASLVDTPKGRESFKAKYNISTWVTIEHCLLGEWYTMRPKGVLVILMIAFIEGGMQIPMGRVIRDFFISHRLCPTQCSLNLFRILGNVNVLNRNRGANFTHHDVNWVYNCQHSKDTGYYFKTRVLSMRLISYILESNNGLDQDFLIISSEWHDGLHCPTQDRKLGGVFICLSKLSLPLDSRALSRSPFF